MHQVVWEMVGQMEFALSTGYGRMIIDPMPNGLVLYRSHIEITKPAELIIQGDDANRFIGTQLFLMGHGDMILSNGEQQQCTPDHAILLRADQSPTKMQFHRPQMLRHIGVSKLLTNYRAEYDTQQGGAPSPLIDMDQPVNAIQRTATPKALRNIAATLGQSKSTATTEAMMLHAQALLFFSTVLQAFEDTPQTTPDMLEKWEIDAVNTVREKLDDTPLADVDITRLSELTHMPSEHLERCFRAITGHSMPEYVQILKLNTAQTMLLNSNAMIKQISFDLGYDYVGNFSRAYQKFFGESPSRTRQRISS